MQLTLPETGPAIEAVLASLRRLRVRNISVEHALQRGIAQQFDADSVPYAKEYKLGPRNRIDFLIVGGIGIEVKKGKPNAGQVAAQVERYCQFDTITQLVLVVERNVFDYNESANGKPVHYIALNKLWGISL